VQGVVTDATGARAAGARVELTNEGAKVPPSRTARVQGDFLFNFVPPGRYTLRVSPTGFMTSTATGIDVAVNKTTRGRGARGGRGRRGY
jgi:hypothetical protein